MTQQLLGYLSDPLSDTQRCNTDGCPPYAPQSRWGDLQGLHGPTAQPMIGEHKRHHRFRHWHRPRTQTWIMAPMDFQLDRSSRLRHRVLRFADRGRRFHSDTDDDILAIRDAAQHPPSMILARPHPSECIGVNPYVML